MFVEVKGADNCIHFININQICEIKKVEDSYSNKVYFTIYLMNGEPIRTDSLGSALNNFLNKNIIK